jgi:hypothetical protein
MEISSTRVIAPRAVRIWALVRVASVKGSVEFIRRREMHEGARHVNEMINR